MNPTCPSSPSTPRYVASPLAAARAVDAIGGVEVQHPTSPAADPVIALRDLQPHLDALQQMQRSLQEEERSLARLQRNLPDRHALDIRDMEARLAQTRQRLDAARAEQRLASSAWNDALPWEQAIQDRLAKEYGRLELLMDKQQAEQAHVAASTAKAPSTSQRPAEKAGPSTEPPALPEELISAQIHLAAVRTAAKNQITLVRQNMRELEQVLAQASREMDQTLGKLGVQAQAELYTNWLVQALTAGENFIVGQERGEALFRLDSLEPPGSVPDAQAFAGVLAQCTAGSPPRLQADFVGEPALAFRQMLQLLDHAELPALRETVDKVAATAITEQMIVFWRDTTRSIDRGEGLPQGSAPSATELTRHANRLWSQVGALLDSSISLLRSAVREAGRSKKPVGRRRASPATTSQDKPVVIGESTIPADRIKPTGQQCVQLKGLLEQHRSVLVEGAAVAMRDHLHHMQCHPAEQMRLFIHFAYGADWRERGALSPMMSRLAEYMQPLARQHLERLQQHDDTEVAQVHLNLDSASERDTHQLKLTTAQEMTDIVDRLFSRLIEGIVDSQEKLETAARSAARSITIDGRTIAKRDYKTAQAHYALVLETILAIGEHHRSTARGDEYATVTNPHLFVGMTEMLSRIIMAVRTQLDRHDTIQRSGRECMAQMQEIVREHQQSLAENNDEAAELRILADKLTKLGLEADSRPVESTQATPDIPVSLPSPLRRPIDIRIAEQRLKIDALIEESRSVAAGFNQADRRLHAANQEILALEETFADLQANLREARGTGKAMAQDRATLRAGHERRIQALRRQREEAAQDILNGTSMQRLLPPAVREHLCQRHLALTADELAERARHYGGSASYPDAATLVDSVARTWQALMERHPALMGAASAEDFQVEARRIANELQALTGLEKADGARDMLLKISDRPIAQGYGSDNTRLPLQQTSTVCVSLDYREGAVRITHGPFPKVPVPDIGGPQRS